MRKRFILFGMGRTGSTLLADLLNSHPQICCEDELFHEKHTPYQLRAIAWLRRRYPLPYLRYRQNLMTMLHGKPVYGFKLHTKLKQAQIADRHGDPAPFLQAAVQSGWQIIHLERNVLFDQLISAFVAGQTGRYFGQPAAQELAVQLTIPVDNFCSRLQRAITISQNNQRILSDIPHLSLTYEVDLVERATWARTMARCCTYLELPVIKPAANHVTKPWCRPYTEIVCNYAELQACYHEVMAAGCVDLGTSAPMNDR